MSRMIQCLLAWRSDLWRATVCLRLPFCQRFFPVTRFSFLSFSHSVSYLCRSLRHFVSFSFRISLPIPMCIRVLSSLSPFLRLLSPFFLLSLCNLASLFVSLSLSSPSSLVSASRLGLCLFVSPPCPSLRLGLSVSASVCLSPPRSPSPCLCLFIFLHHLLSLPHHFTAHLSGPLYASDPRYLRYTILH